MITEAGADARDGHFDRRESLEQLLADHTPSSPQVANIADYESWAPSRQRKFDEDRTERIARSIVVETPQLRQLGIEYRRASMFARRPIGRTGVILTGPATTGKTTAAFQIMLQAMRAHESTQPEWRARGEIPVVYVEVPPKVNAKVLMGRFLHFLGLPVLPRMTLEERTSLVTDVLNRANVRLVVVDEMQNLLQASGRFETAQALKNLMNSVRAVPLYVGIDLDRSALTNSELGAQFASRCALVSLDRMALRSRDDRRLWGGLIVGFERQLPLLNHPERTLLPLAEYLWRRTGGSIAALSRLLTFAALDLVNENEPESETITRERLDSIRLDLTTERAANLLRSRSNQAESEAGRAA